LAWALIAAAISAQAKKSDGSANAFGRTPQRFSMSPILASKGRPRWRWTS